jgi:branched-chain amino acid transport system substrate-binding protein
MICNGRIIQSVSFAMAACALLSSAPASAQGVKIGVLNDQSGNYADFGGKGSVEAAKMAVEDFGGSVLGQKIELINADHQNKPDLATAIARRWYDVEDVDMITDLTLSSVALAVQQITAEKKKIDIVVASSTPALTASACTPYGFDWAYDSHALAVSTGGALVRTGADTWFFVTVDTTAGHATEKDTSEIITASRGKVLGHVLFPLNTPDFSSFLLQAQSSKAEIVALNGGGKDAII